jgi:hypothetical protein
MSSRPTDQDQTKRVCLVGPSIRDANAAKLKLFDLKSTAIGFKCPVCKNDNFTELHELWAWPLCGHVFCLDCSFQLVFKGTGPCPMCRNSALIDREEQGKLFWATNLHLNVDTVRLEAANTIVPPPTIVLFTRLRFLVLDNCLLSVLPIYICDLPLLEWLFIQHNDLHELPVDIQRLSALKHLFAHDNRLTLVPALPPLLRTLDMSWNRLDSVPDAIFDLEHLQSLNLARNPLQAINTDILKLTSLRELKIDDTAALDEFNHSRAA